MMIFIQIPNTKLLLGATAADMGSADSHVSCLVKFWLKMGLKLLILTHLGNKN